MFVKHEMICVRDLIENDPHSTGGEFWGEGGYT